MDEFFSLFGVDSNQALQFFEEYLKDELGSESGLVGVEERLYVASFFAHYTQTPRDEMDSSVAPSGSPRELLDNFVLPELTAEGARRVGNPGTLEVAGAQTLVVVSFFSDHLEKKANPRFYESLGQSFFSRASLATPSRKKALLLWQVARHFPLWANTGRRVSRRLRDEPYLLKIP